MTVPEDDAAQDAATKKMMRFELQLRTFALQPAETDDAADGEKPRLLQTPLGWPGTIDWLYVRTPDVQENRSEVTPVEEHPDVVAFVLEPAIAVIAGVDVPATFTRVDAVVLREHLRAHGGIPHNDAATALLTTDGEIALEIVRSLKGAHASAERPPGLPVQGVITNRAGQRGEIRPLIDPTAITAGSELLFEVVFDPLPSDGVWLRAVHVESGETVVGQVQEGGTISMLFEQAGLWLLESCTLEIMPQDEQDRGLRMRMIVATLTFEIAEREM